MPFFFANFGHLVILKEHEDCCVFGDTMEGMLTTCSTSVFLLGFDAKFVGKTERPPSYRLVPLGGERTACLLKQLELSNRRTIFSWRFSDCPKKQIPFHLLFRNSLLTWSAVLKFPKSIRFIKAPWAQVPRKQANKWVARISSDSPNLFPPFQQASLCPACSRPTTSGNVSIL